MVVTPSPSLVTTVTSAVAEEVSHSPSEHEVTGTMVVVKVACLVMVVSAVCDSAVSGQ